MLAGLWPLGDRGAQAADGHSSSVGNGPGSYPNPGTFQRIGRRKRDTQSQIADVPPVDLISFCIVARA